MGKRIQKLKKRIQTWSDWEIFVFTFFIGISTIFISLGIVAVSNVSERSMWYAIKEILSMIGSIIVIILVIILMLVIFYLYQRYVSIQKENDEYKGVIKNLEDELKRLKGNR